VVQEFAVSCHKVMTCMEFEVLTEVSRFVVLDPEDEGVTIIP
jgi:hypothetical protein